MTELRNDDFDLDALMSRIRDDVARRRGVEETCASDASDGAGKAGLFEVSSGAGGGYVGAGAPEAPRAEMTRLPRFAESNGPIPRKEAYDLRDFLTFHDEDFVRNTYRGILRREPDGEGLEHFLKALRHGDMAKAEVLGRVRYSREGRAIGVPVRGLSTAFALRSIRRVPVLGRLIGILQYFLRLPEIVRNHERLEAVYFQRQFELNRSINHCNERIEEGLAQGLDLVRETRASLDVARNDWEMAHREIAGVRGEMDNVRDRLAIASLELASKLSELSALAEAKVDRDLLDRAMTTFEDRLSHAALEHSGKLKELLALAESKADRMEVDRAIREFEGSLATSLLEISSGLSAVRVNAEVEVEPADSGRVMQLVGDRLTAATGGLAEVLGELTLMAVRAATQNEMTQVKRALEFKADNEVITRQSERMLEQLQRRPEKAELDALSGRTDEAIAAVLQRTDELRAFVREHERRLTMLVAEMQRKRQVTAAPDELLPGDQDTHLFDAFYAAFENRFRGTRGDIKQRVSVYLPVIRDAGAGTPEGMVVDIGCGRGEWLELLRENGLVGRGLDLNRVMVAQCQERGLDVSMGEAVDHLRSLAPESLGAVTAMHVIEHVSFRQLVELFDQVLRVLKPGGVAIFETPNPENLAVGACNFYFDPTHERPLPPESTRFVAESRGFVHVEILRLHPVPVSERLGSSGAELREVLDRYLYGPQDYALVARKPA